VSNLDFEIRVLIMFLPYEGVKFYGVLRVKKLFNHSA